MAKSLSSIMSQIERLQKEAAAIQSDVVVRIRKDIAKFGLTAEQLFGPGASAGVRKGSRSRNAVQRAPKYADGAGNTWGGMGKRPDWLRKALQAGGVLEQFLVADADVAGTPATPTRRAVKAAPAAKRKPGPKPGPKAARVSKAPDRKPRAKAASSDAARN